MWENPQILKLSTKNKLVGTEFVLRWNIQKCDFEISSMEKRNYVNFFCCSYFFINYCLHFVGFVPKKHNFLMGKYLTTFLQFEEFMNLRDIFGTVNCAVL